MAHFIINLDNAVNQSFCRAPFWPFRGCPTRRFYVWVLPHHQPGPACPPASSFVILRRTDKPACRRRGSPIEDSGLAGKDLNFNEAKVVRARVIVPRVFRTKPSLNTNAPPQPDLLCSAAQALDPPCHRGPIL